MEQLTPIITPKFKILAIVIALATISYIIFKIRQGRLHIKHSLLWLAVSCVMIVLATYPKFFFYISQQLGFILPINALTFFSIIFLLIIIFNLTLIISNL